MSEANGQPLPPGWSWANLEDVVQVLDRARVPVNAKERAGRRGNVPYYGATGQVGWIDEYLFDEPLVLLGEDGAPFFDKTRDVAYTVSGKSWVNNHAHVLRPEPGIAPTLLSQQLNVVDYRRFVSGTTRWKLSQAPMRKIPLRIPPLREQVRIADALDEILSDLDVGLAGIERVLAKLAQYRAAVLKAAVEGALTAEWRQQHPATEPATVLLTRILAERRRRWEADQLRKFQEAGKEPPKHWKSKYQEPVTPDTTNLPPLPDGWCWVSLDQLAEIAGGVTKGQKFSPQEKTRLVSYLRVANVQRGWLDLGEIKEIRATEADIKALCLQPGDVLFNEGGDRDKLGRGWIWEGQIPECVHQNHVFRARLLSSEVPPKLVSWCGNSYGQRWFMRTGKQSVNLASINLTVLRSFPVPLAPVSEQEAIVEAVEDQLSVIEHIKAELATKLKGAQALRQSILHHAFTGQLVPQDPKDEPAAALLQRIAAEREARARQALAAKRGSAKPERVRKPRSQ